MAWLLYDLWESGISRHDDFLVNAFAIEVLYVQIVLYFKERSIFLDEHWTIYIIQLYC